MTPKIILIALSAALVGAGQAETDKRDASHARKRIAVLDLVEMGENQVKPEYSDILRKQFAATGKWNVIGKDSINKRLSDFNMSLHQGCNNPQCSFDVGNIVQADFVLFGTASALSPVQAVTLKLLNIASAKIVWTKVAETQAAADPERLKGLEKIFSEAVAEISKGKFNLEKTHGKSLAVVDLSENSLQSRVFFERVCTRIYGTANFDLMSPSELGELLTALEINKYSVVPSLDNMIGLGQKLGVSNLIYSRLYRDGKSYIYRLAMYDIAAKALVLEMPPQPSEDLLKLLEYEKVFFNTLFSKGQGEQKTAAVKDGGKSNKALWISLGVLGVGGGVAAYWVESLRKSGGSGDGNGGGIPLPPNPPDDPEK